MNNITIIVYINLYIYTICIYIVYYNIIKYVKVCDITLTKESRVMHAISMIL